MAGWGLIGAAGGLGKALQDVGKSLEERRAAALEAARKEAIEEARLAQQAQLAEQRQGFERDQTIYREEQQNLRSEAQIAGRQAEGAANRASRASLQDKLIAGQRGLAQLRGQIQRDNTAAGIKLRQSLTNPNVHAVGYDKVDKNGYGEVILIRKDGKIQRTGERIKVPEGSDGLIYQGGGGGGGGGIPGITPGVPVAPAATTDDDDEDDGWF